MLNIFAEFALNLRVITFIYRICDNQPYRDDSFRHNIFIRMNILAHPASEESLAALFHLLSQPSRLQILRTIGRGEACVCHLEAALGLRQAAISQHLMVLRDAGLVITNRDGRNIYYQLASPAVLDLVDQAARLFQAGDSPAGDGNSSFIDGCPCPHCAEAAGMPPEQARGIACH